MPGMYFPGNICVNISLQITCVFVLNVIGFIIFMPENIFACLFSVLNTISLSRHEQV